MLYGRIYLILLFLVFTCNLYIYIYIYIYLSKRVRSSVIHLNGFYLLVPLPFLVEITSCDCFYQQNKSLCLRQSSERLLIFAKELLNLPNLRESWESWESCESQDMRVCHFREKSLLWILVKNVLSKDKSAVPLFNGSDYLFSASDNTNFVKEICYKNSNLNESGRSVYAFPCRTNQKIHISVVALKMSKKVI